MKEFPTAMMVVAGAIADGEGRWLLQRRPLDKHHGGLWEFPGGKVEANESPRAALVRELLEELAITVDPATLVPAGFADGAGEGGAGSLVILLYKVAAWSGTPAPCEEGSAIGWFTRNEFDDLPRPPLDIALAQGLHPRSIEQ